MVSSLGEIFRLHGQDYLDRFGDSMPARQRSVLKLLSACQNGELGLVLWHCDSCNRPHQTPRSCGDRHCPTCQSSKNDQWQAEQVERLLEVPYFFVTFTLPMQLRPFVRSHQRACYKAFFDAASASLKKLARDPRHLGASQLGFTAILHTWGRDLTYNPHLHVIVPGGGLSDDGSEWLSSRVDFLVPVKALSRIFRAKFRDAMKRVGLFDQIDPAVWGKNFVTDSEAVGDGRTTLRYLSRYVFRVAISNSRILSCENGRVRFRWQKSGTRRWRVMELDALEFVRRFLKHVLPSGLQKVRHYGFLSPNSRVSLNDVRKLMSDASAADEVDEAIELPSATEIPPQRMDSPSCPHCGGRLRVVEIIFRRTSFQDSG